MGDQVILDHGAAVEAHSRHALALGGVARTDVQRQIGSVRNQALFVWTNRVEDAFTRERLVFHHAETAAVECQAAGVSQPQRPLRSR
jgi:hypothetical protein